MQAMTEQEQGYNGWTNYPTWAVNLWLSNDEGLYLYMSAIVAETLDNTRHNDHPDALPARLAIADITKDWVRDELTPDLGASFAADLLGYALDQVNWLEIADAWIETAGEQ